MTDKPVLAMSALQELTVRLPLADQEVRLFLIENRQR